LGSNVGDRLNYILKALDHIENYGKILKCSTVYESQPWGVKDQPSFLNSVVMVETNLRPVELLHRVKKSEILLGRKNRGRWGPREIDIDILLYEDHIIMLSFLKIPHPHLLERDFVLIPLLEIAPHLIHPLYKTPLSQYVNKIEISLKPFACLYGIDSKG
jgi:2-amino-4-hydroxy-6-hydroxymethyldihydropteridine pyrophosphokinase